MAHQTNLQYPVPPPTFEHHMPGEAPAMTSLDPPQFGTTNAAQQEESRRRLTALEQLRARTAIHCGDSVSSPARWLRLRGKGKRSTPQGSGRCRQGTYPAAQACQDSVRAHASLSGGPNQDQGPLASYHSDGIFPASLNGKQMDAMLKKFNDTYLQLQSASYSEPEHF
jgi:hypothetical protein